MGPDLKIDPNQSCPLSSRFKRSSGLVRPGREQVKLQPDVIRVGVGCAHNRDFRHGFVGALPFEIEVEVGAAITLIKLPHFVQVARNRFLLTVTVRIYGSGGDRQVPVPNPDLILTVVGISGLLSGAK